MNDNGSTAPRRTASERSTSPALDAFLESYFRLRPVNATFTGVHNYDHLLPDWSPEGLAAAEHEMRRLRRVLAQEMSLSSASAQTEGGIAIDIALADSFLEIQIAELQGRHFHRGNPSLVVGEGVFAVISLMIRDFAPFDARLASAIERMAVLPAFLDGTWRSLDGHAIPGEWVAKALRETEGARRLFDPGIRRWCEAFGASEFHTARAVDTATSALAAFERFAAHIAAAPMADDASYACGSQLLALLVRRGHWVDIALDTLLIEAQQRFEEARIELQEMASHVASGGWPEVQERLAALHPTPDEYLPAFERTWAACRDLVCAGDLVAWPDAPLRYAPIPEWTREAAPFLYYLFYRSPAPYDEIPVHDYVVTPLPLDAEGRARHLRAWNDSVIKLNHVVHHGAIGHHVQNWHANHRGTSAIGRLAAVDCASRIAMFLGGTLAEGWACYATDLMGEVGFTTQLEAIAEQYALVRQLGRAIVDISLHTGATTLDEAIAFYRDRVGIPAEQARAECVKNSMFPGTAMMYWLGAQGLHDLRRACEARDGSNFSLRAFHDEVLSFGAIPVTLISRLMLDAETGAGRLETGDRARHGRRL